jgi:hypothetical protein
VSKQKPENSGRGARIERRLQARESADSTDWETIVLRRVARRVTSLTGDPNTQLDPSDDRGWEESALLALRRGVRELKSE